MTIQLNGQKTPIARQGMNINEFLREIGLGGKPVLVEHNGVALHQHEREETYVHDGDVIELINVVAGG